MPKNQKDGDMKTGYLLGNIDIAGTSPCSGAADFLAEVVLIVSCFCNLNGGFSSKPCLITGGFMHTHTYIYIDIIFICIVVIHAFNLI